MRKVEIVGIGGTLRPNSSSARALRYCLDYAEGAGASIALFVDDDLRASLYEPGRGGAGWALPASVACPRFSRLLKDG